MKTGAMVLNGTGLQAVTRLAQHASVTGFNEPNSYTFDTPTVIELEKKYYFSEPRQVASSITEIQYNDTFHLRKESSMRVTLTLSTQNEAVSPVVNVQRTNAILSKNLIDKPSYDNFIYGARSTTVTYSSDLPETLAVNNLVGFTNAAGETKNVRVSYFNPRTRKVTFKGLHSMGLRKATGFSDAAMPFSDSIKISESAPDQLIPETENNGSAFAKWISKVFVLENQCDGLELRLASIFYDPTNIRVYYRPKAVGFDGNINTLNWIPFNAQQPAPGEVVKVDKDGKLYYPDDQTVDYFDPELVYLPTPGLCDNADRVNPRSSAVVDPDIIGKADWSSLTWTIQDIAKFEAIQIKIVMTCDNPAKPPLIDDMQLIASE